MLINRLLAILLLAGITAGSALPQSTGSFSLDAYQAFLDAHKNLESAQLQSMYPAGTFRASVPAVQPQYLDSIAMRYALTPYENQLLAGHGFVVTSRLSQETMIGAFADIYRKDLPVFVSTDAILEAVHFSYDRILMDVERGILVPGLTSLLNSIKAQLPIMAQRYEEDPRMGRMMRDVDVYITVPQLLLGEDVQPLYADNLPIIDSLLALIGAQQPSTIALFAFDTSRLVDFSQFTLRGHYTQDSLLAHYFRAMMWLSRTEFYLLPPAGTLHPPSPRDVQRQTIDAFLVKEAVQGAGAQPALEKIDSLIAFMVGESDNVSIDELESLAAETGIDSAGSLQDSARLGAFQDTLGSRPFAFQRINSQILIADLNQPAEVRPASSFMLLGQRFVIDSYITGNVVFDKIVHNGEKVRRMLPSTLDVLFALGNDAALQILDPTLQYYHYSSNLAALRYLVDSYDEDFWNCSLFYSWLAMIRTLNPPDDRSALPSFMQTGAWWQEKMNTQLASWAQLRHDNLLYAKQSYTPGFIICSYPQSYVEPIPEFFHRVKSYAALAAPRFSSLGLPAIAWYFNVLGETADTLGTIAEKELSGTTLAATEISFLRTMLSLYTGGGGCGPEYPGYSGWYPRLFYGVNYGVDQGSHPELLKTDFVVADVHTSPMDSAGNPVGWVLHVGAGPIDLAVVTAQVPGGQWYAFVGPVLNYYERLTTDFVRLTDEEWKTLYALAPTLRPDFVNVYLANEAGESRGGGSLLVTGIPEGPAMTRAASFTLAQNFPNPFNPSTFIAVTVPMASNGERVRLDVFDIRGAFVARLLDEVLAPGNYLVRWDGRDDGRRSVATGVYFYRLKAGGFSETKKMVLLR